MLQKLSELGGPDSVVKEITTPPCRKSIKKHIREWVMRESTGTTRGSRLTLINIGANRVPPRM